MADFQDIEVTSTGFGRRDQFTRREFGKALLAAGSLFAAVGQAATAAQPTPLFDFAIAGGWYHGLKDLRADIAVGESLALRLEPDNPHDACAIAVHRRDGVRLGYVPRAANPPIARLLQQGAHIAATVVGRLSVRPGADRPYDLAYTGFSDGDPRIRLTLAT